MQLDNHSPWAAMLVPGWAQHGEMQMACVIKTGFQWRVDGSLVPLLADDCPLVLSDQYIDDNPDTHSIALAGDLVPFKQGFEWFLHGSVVPMKGAFQQRLSVSFLPANTEQSSISSHNKTIYAFGPRSWKKNLFGIVPGEPTEVEPVPITYEHAFGGQFIINADKVIRYDANPVGVGFYRTQKRLGTLAMPLFEYSPFITSTKVRPQPAGFGPISMTWAPRSELFRHMNNEAAADGQCPYPDDIEANLFNAAPIDQRMEQAPEPGTQLLLEGFAEKLIALELPDIASQIQLHILKDGQVTRLLPVCDTLIVDTDARTLSFVWRIAVPWNPLGVVDKQIVLAAKQPESAEASVS